MRSHATRFLAFLLLAAPSVPVLAGDVSVRIDTDTGFSVKNGTGAIERLRVDEATGNVSRNGVLFVHTTGSQNLFVGPGAGNTSTTGSFGNMALGESALRSVTTGTGNSAVGTFALYSNGTGYDNSAVGSNALFSNTTGRGNTAVGRSALSGNSVGEGNSALGNAALVSNTGSHNTAVGFWALFRNTTASDNTAVGMVTLFNNTTGGLNSAFGSGALHANITGNFNSAVGNGALGSNTSGANNVAVGIDAGRNQTTGSNNIYLANQGTAAETGQIKIGTVGTHTQAAIAGISGNTSAGGIAVLVNANGVLGTTTSSARFKEDVRDMGDASDLLMRLRPVTFRYTEAAAGADEAKTPQYGLIAEEVAEVAPELVAPDLDGRPYSVKYHELPALLLNEVQVQRRTIATLEARIAELEKRPLYTEPREVAR